MEVVQLKKTSGSVTEDFNALYIIPYRIEDYEKYTDVNFVRRKLQNAYWLAFEIRFALLTAAKMDYLNEIRIETAPQAIIDSTTYNIDILELNVRPTGGLMKIAKTSAE
ncbi:MAG: hypothetical protein V3W20_03780 [Candidatus Neomarinimicrobiota bacterium]